VRNHMRASFVASHFREKEIWTHIKEPTPAKDHSSAVSVRKSL